jgi:hypothetical protein
MKAAKSHVVVEGRCRETPLTIMTCAFNGLLGICPRFKCMWYLPSFFLCRQLSGQYRRHGQARSLLRIFIIFSMNPIYMLRLHF